MTSDSQLCKECSEAQEKSDLDICRLIQKLEKIKLRLLTNSRGLTERQMIYLCLALCLDSNGKSLYTPRQIAAYFYLHKIPAYTEDFLKDKDVDKYVEIVIPDMSKTIHTYIKNLLGLSRKPFWTTVVYLLKEQGYLKKIDNDNRRNNTMYKREVSTNRINVAMYLIEGEITESMLMGMFKEKGFPNIKVRKVV